MVAHGGIRPVHSNSHHWLAGSVTCEVVWGAMALDKAGAAVLRGFASACLATERSGLTEKGKLKMKNPECEERRRGR